MMAGSHVDGQFRRMAESVTEKVSELLRAPVFVMSDSGGTVATSGPDLPRVVAGQLSGEAMAAYLRVPFKVGDQAGEVVVGHSEDVEPVSPRVAQALVEMIINEMAVIDRLPEPTRGQEQADLRPAARPHSGRGADPDPGPLPRAWISRRRGRSC